MSTRRKRPKGSPIVRAPHLNGWTLAALAGSGGDRLQTLRVLRGAVERGEVARIECGGRVLWGEVPPQHRFGRQKSAAPPPVLGLTLAAIATRSGASHADALHALNAAMERGEIARIKTDGRELWARVGGGEITDVAAADRQPMTTNERNER